MIRIEFDSILTTCLNLIKVLNPNIEEAFEIQETFLELIPRLVNINREQFNMKYAKEVITLLSEWCGPVSHFKFKIAFCIGSISLALSNTSNEFNNFSRKFLDSFFSDNEIKLKTDDLNSIMACATMFRKSVLSEISLHKSFYMDSIEFFMNAFNSTPYFLPTLVEFLNEVFYFKSTNSLFFVFLL